MPLFWFWMRPLPWGFKETAARKQSVFQSSDPYQCFFRLAYPSILQRTASITGSASREHAYLNLVRYSTKLHELKRDISVFLLLEHSQDCSHEQSHAVVFAVLEIVCQGSRAIDYALLYGSRHLVVRHDGLGLFGRKSVMQSLDEGSDQQAHLIVGAMFCRVFH